MGALPVFRMTGPPLLAVQHLRVHFPAKPALLGSVKSWLNAVDDVSFEIGAGETLGLVGESGCGKTTLGRAVVRLVEPIAGQLLLEGKDITRVTGSELRSLRRRFQMIFQDPYSSLDPRLTIEDSIGEALDIHRLVPTRQDRRERIAALLKDVGLDP